MCRVEHIRHWLAHDWARPRQNDHDEDVAHRQQEMEETLAALQARADLIQGQLQRHIKRESRNNGAR